MSQLYQIQLKASVRESYQLSDSIVHKIALTPILPEAEMKELLRQTLEQTGFAKENEDTFQKQGKQGETITVDLKNMQVTASLEKTKELQTEITVHGQAWDSHKKARQDARQKRQTAEQHARSQLDSESRSLQKELTQTLEQGEAQRMRELNEILQQVYAESLKRKAAQLGDIMNVQESTQDGQYELVIHIEQ